MPGDSPKNWVVISRVATKLVNSASSYSGTSAISVASSRVHTR